MQREFAVEFRIVPSLQVRDLPEAIYRKLADCAHREHRTLSQQATILLAKALEVSLSPQERRQRLLKELRERPLVESWEGLEPPEVVVREDRQR